LLAKAEFSDGDAAYAAFVAKCDKLRIGGGSLDDLEIKDGTVLAGHLVTATRLTPILYEKFHGNPRRIKRFLNDLNVRQAVARRRGFELKADEVAKLMVLERILTDDFETVLGWLASNQLRDKLDALDATANGRIAEAEDSASEASEDEKPDEERSKKKATVPVPEQEPARDDGFSDTLRRWAKLPPVLDASAISGYLYLAASFAKIEVIDTELPERLRDLAVALTSSLKIDRAGVTDENLKLLPESDAQILVAHLGRRTRDQPTLQKFTVESLLRLAAQQPTTQPNVVAALRGIPAANVEPATIIKLRPLDQTVYRPVLEAWRTGSDDQQLQQSVSIVETTWSSNGN